MQPLPIALPSPVSKSLLERYHRVVPVQGERGKWNRQECYGEDFTNMKRPLREDDLRAMLEHGAWLACPARRDGTTDRIGVDLDCEGESDVRRRDALYWSVRRIFGMCHTPLVWATPSGHGLRVYYAIPRTDLARLVTGLETGLLADILRAEALPVYRGALEIFPQVSQADRLPLGRRMPLLDPATLRELPDAAIGDTFQADMLAGALAEMERWLAMPCIDLLAHLESLPRLSRPLVISARLDDGVQEGLVRTAKGIAPSRANRALARHGLTGPHSRYRAEWMTGITLLLEPALFADLGLRNAMDDSEVARTLARWVAERNNGFSKEWTDSRRRCRSVELALRVWESRYLERGAVSGAHMVDRLRRAVAALDGSMRRTILLSENERLEFVAVAEGAGLKTSMLFRAESWLSSYQRAVKSIVNYRARRDMPTPERTRDGKRTVVVPIAARWMEEWQFGKGRYTEYRKLLIGAKRMRITRFSPTASAFRRGARLPDDLEFEATEYEVRMPEMDLLVRDVGIHPQTLKCALAELRPTMSGRPLTLDTAHHIHWLYRSGVPLRRRYGSRLGRSIEAIGAEIDGKIATQGARILEMGNADVTIEPSTPG